MAYVWHTLLCHMCGTRITYHTTHILHTDDTHMTHITHTCRVPHTLQHVGWCIVTCGCHYRHFATCATHIATCATPGATPRCRVFSVCHSTGVECPTLLYSPLTPVFTVLPCVQARVSYPLLSYRAHTYRRCLTVRRTGSNCVSKHCLEQRLTHGQTVCVGKTVCV